ncbi:hypothetical protein DICVIV_06119 [Dictyocaulus viviparus]|uniref:Uncharacterized protein n=1 Tax=Dictyocaulus viviparus TaxID=29172 RepID=A0A0D8XZL0_DICVI|nr:hypothetical protein DICVIV_06119 [Dictyocaulus viviparus]
MWPTLSLRISVKKLSLKEQLMGETTIGYQLLKIKQINKHTGENIAAKSRSFGGVEVTTAANIKEPH